MLLTTLIMQQHAALTNIQTAKFIKLRESEDPMRESPPTNSIAIKIVWVEYFWVNTLISDPPHKYPIALTKKMNENEVYAWPVAYAKYGMIGPIPVMILP